ncbi:MAG: alpha/beta hydrolase [Eubacteriales bacterium]|nr:alpha/beta hydrolase [Eubacteriales bacterium]
MKHTEIRVRTKFGEQARMYTYFLDNSPEMDPARKRPLVLICPGGGYHMTSDREAEAVAVQFLSMGFHACVLRYSVKPAEFPQALCELAWCVNHLRSNAGEYAIDPNRIIVLGFSAAGHLAASLGVFWQEAWLSKAAGLPSAQIRPDGLILCYPVITAGEYAHQGSIENLLGEKDTPDMRDAVSLEKHVTSLVPPVFLWHTQKDNTVPVENALLLINELQKHKVPMEVHIFAEGLHGLSLANEETKNKDGYGVQECCQIWPKLAGDWIRGMK